MSARLFIALISVIGAFFVFTGFRMGALPFTPNARYSDAVTSHFPAALYLRESVQGNGDIQWRETIMGGQPFMANPLNKTAYPLQWIAVLLPAELHLNIMIALHMGIAMWGMYRWARRLGLRVESAVLAAAAYGLSPRLVGHLGAGHLDIVYALAWFPHVMGALERIFDGRQAGVPAGRPYIVLALCAALVFLADIRAALFVFGLAAWYAGHRMVQMRAWRRTVALIGAAALVIVLTLSVTYSLLAWSPYLSRAALSPVESGVFSLELPMLLGLLVPAGRNVELLTYVGLAVLALAIIGVLSAPRRHAFWVTVIAVSVWYALGLNGALWTILVEIFPPLLWFRVPSRAWLIIALVAPLLAAYGLDALLSRKNVPKALGYLSIGVVCVELLFTARGWIEWRGRDAWLPDSQVQLAETLIADGARRVYSPTYSLEQQTAAAYGLEIFGGVDPFQLQVAVDAIQQGGGIDFDGYSVVQPPLVGIEGDDPATANRSVQPDPVLLGQWGVTHVVSAYPISVPQLEQIDAPDDVYLYTNRAPIVDRGHRILGDDDIVEYILAFTWLAAVISSVTFIACIIALFLQPQWGRSI
ncbi:MAG: hypothetical protein SGI73_14440 [Chloroflexota bacterium]|nr:hypothetical protein [Chloroflexota bacterium]